MYNWSIQPGSRARIATTWPSSSTIQVAGYGSTTVATQARVSSSQCRGDGMAGNDAWREASHTSATTSASPGSARRIERALVAAHRPDPQTACHRSDGKQQSSGAGTTFSGEGL